MAVQYAFMIIYMTLLNMKQNEYSTLCNRVVFDSRFMIHNFFFVFLFFVFYFWHMKTTFDPPPQKKSVRVRCVLFGSI